jgi:hypothetical protein
MAFPLSQSLIASARENYPAIECGSAAETATTWPDPGRRGRAFDHVADADLLFLDEARQADTIRLAFPFLPGFPVTSLFLGYGITSSHERP